MPDEAEGDFGNLLNIDTNCTIEPAGAQKKCFIRVVNDGGTGFPPMGIEMRPWFEKEATSWIFQTWAYPIGSSKLQSSAC